MPNQANAKVLIEMGKKLVAMGESYLSSDDEMPDDEGSMDEGEMDDSPAPADDKESRKAAIIAVMKKKASY